MPATNQNIEVFTGDYVPIDFIVTDEKGNPVDLTGYGAKWAVKQNMYADTNLIYKDTSSGGIVISNGTSGIFTVLIDSIDTESLAAGQYIHVARVIDPSGRPMTVTTGEFKVKTNKL